MMIHRCCVLALLAGLSSGAAAEDELTPFSMFGARESISHIDLSPDGKRVVYVSPAPGAGSVALVTDLESGKSSFLVKTSGEPDTLEWCNFVTNEEFICEVGGVVARTEYLVPYVRLIAISESDKKPRLLGQSNSIFDAGNRQFDGAIVRLRRLGLDWGCDKGRRGGSGDREFQSGSEGIGHLFKDELEAI